MAIALLKLYKDPVQAETALEALLKGGFKVEELSVMGSSLSLNRLGALKGARREKVSLDGHPLEAIGPLAGQVNQGELATFLREALGVPEDALEYYRFGLITRGVLLSVHGEGRRGEEARHLLRPLEGLAVEKAQSPGFDRASRMTGSDPVDARMTGDFRRY